MKLADFNRLAERSDPTKASYFGAVISVHGANTRGAWQKVLHGTFQDYQIRHEAVDYGYRLLGTFRRKTISDISAKIVEAYQELLRYYPYPGVVAHSLGTLGLGSALYEYRELELRRIIVCGCILPRDFQWETLAKRGQVSRVLNEKAGRDHWVRLAGRVSRLPMMPSCGDAGWAGFTTCKPLVDNSDDCWAYHSTALNKLRCQKVWVPFLLGKD